MFDKYASPMKAKMKSPMKDKMEGMKDKMEDMKPKMEGMKDKMKSSKPCECSSEELNELSKMFRHLSSSLYVLAIKIKGYHWNMVGNQFFPIHADLDCQISTLIEFSDGAAELIRQINKGVAPASMKDMLGSSFIKENNIPRLITAEKFLPVIVSDYTAMAKHCAMIIEEADEYNRQDLSDFAIGIVQFVNKYKWQFDSAMK